MSKVNSPHFPPTDGGKPVSKGRPHRPSFSGDCGLAPIFLAASAAGK